jgi:protein-S-isoprenylcysteine O-methyltransferase Ste14
MKPVLAGDVVDSRISRPASLGLALDGSPARVPARQGWDQVADFVAKAFGVALFSFLAVRIGADFLSTGRLTGLLLLASEALVVILTVFRRTPAVVDRSAKARVLTALSLIGPLLVRPGEVAALAAEAATVSASALGLMVVIAGKVSLGRSFGLIPANRGVVCSGPYRLVRHPIYLGYLITHVAFVAANPTMWNMVVFAIADVALLARAVCEEETLTRDEAYKAYTTRVRWRVVPGAF